MSSPIKKVIPGSRVYRPYRPKPDRAVDEYIDRVLGRDLEAEYLEFFEAIHDLEVLSMAPNKTGRLVVAKLKVLGRPFKMSLCPYGQNHSSRSLGSVVDEVIEALAKKPLPGSKTRLSKTSLLQLVSDTVRPMLQSKEYCGHSVIMTSLSQGLVPDFVVPSALGPAPGPALLHRALTEFVSSGRHLGNFQDHQRKRAIDNFRQMACHAFKNGAALEDMVKALEEEMVRATMEA